MPSTRATYSASKLRDACVWLRLPAQSPTCEHERLDTIPCQTICSGLRPDIQLHRSSHGPSHHVYDRRCQGRRLYPMLRTHFEARTYESRRSGSHVGPSFFIVPSPSIVCPSLEIVTRKR